MAKRRAAIACESCGDVFVGHVSADGTIRPIGVNACSCGGTTFSVLEDAREETNDGRNNDAMNGDVIGSGVADGERQ